MPQRPPMFASEYTDRVPGCCILSSTLAWLYFNTHSCGRSALEPSRRAGCFSVVDFQNSLVLIILAVTARVLLSRQSMRRVGTASPAFFPIIYIDHPTSS